jgi:hypothetical protein
MIYECPSGHICFSKEERNNCAMRGCIKLTIALCPTDINWFYKINKDGLCIDRGDLHMIIDDPNIPKDVKKQIEKIFPHLSTE